MRITAVDAWEVLDSRGHPTVRGRVTADGDAVPVPTTGTFTVPAGASTGAHEAVERRDGEDRYGGRGVRSAVRAVRNDLAPAVVGADPRSQSAVDEALVDRDGTDDLSACGANAVLAVSGAVAHAAAGALDRPLYAHLASVAGSDGGPGRIPTPTVNVVSGGEHAPGGLAAQDVLVVPHGADTYGDALETAWAVRSAVRDRIVDAGHRPLVADEGGFAPPLSGVDAAFGLVVGGIEDAGYVPGSDVSIAVDVAATHLYDGAYHVDGRQLSTGEMVDRVADWVDTWPLVSVEDPLAEDDWDGWVALADRIADDALLLGDDLLVTDTDRLDRSVERGAATALLVKPNQAGTLTGAIEATRAARVAGVEPVVSARSGETCDATIADLAVGIDAGQIKVGSLARSERLAKYNRLLEIDREHDGAFEGGAPYPGLG